MRTGSEHRDGWLILLACALVAGAVSWIRSVEAGQQVGENSAYAREMGFVQHFFYKSGGNGDGQVEYICSCFPGTTGCGTTSSAVWQVQRLTYDSSSRVATKSYAAGDDAFGSICDNRSVLDYVD